MLTTVTIERLFEVILGKIDSRFEAIEARFEAIENRFMSSCLSPMSQLASSMVQQGSFSTPNASVNAVAAGTEEDETTGGTSIRKEDSFLMDKMYHRQKWIKSKNEDYQEIWNSDEPWVKAAEHHFPDLGIIRFK